MTSTLLRGGTIVSSEGELNADVLIKDGSIKKILKRPYEPRLISSGDAKFDEEIDVSGKLLFPGLIDCHVHFREPGLEQKETMATGAAAALAGGVTTVCEMPNTIPPTVTVAALADKVRRACGINSADDASVSRRFKSAANEQKMPEFIPVDMRFFFGATEPAHLQVFRELWTGSSAELQCLKKRCCGLKLYFDHSTGDQGAGTNVIEEAFKLCGELGVTVVCHCEDSEMNHEARIMNQETGVEAHSKIRPPESEEKAVKHAIALAEKYGTHLHVAHLSTKGGLELIRKAKKSGIAVTCEVAPHHLFLTVDDYAALGTFAKMNPPLRTREHQDALWQGIMDGTVDCISTDHAPHTLEEKKTGEPLKAPSGVPGTETMLPLLLSVAAGKWPHPSGCGLRVAGCEAPVTRNSKLVTADICRLCFTNPNRIFHLGKQGIVEGAPADLIIVDPKKEWTIKGKELHSKCGWSPYENRKVLGKVVQVIQ